MMRATRRSFLDFTPVALAILAMVVLFAVGEAQAGPDAEAGPDAVSFVGDAVPHQFSVPDRGEGDQSGEELYQSACSSCHGPDARGTDDGPSLLREGPAAVDWVLRTGRMPLFAPEDQAVARGRIRFDQAEIDRITDHLLGLGMEGPSVPDRELGNGDIVNGGELFRRNCAACHQAVAQGGIVDGGRRAPSLQDVDTRTVAEVLAVGPGVMPSFADFTDSEVDDLATWITTVAQRPDDRGGFGIGHIGPVAEGLVIWIFLAVAVIGALRWIGARASSERVRPPLATSAASPEPLTPTPTPSVHHIEAGGGREHDT